MRVLALLLSATAASMLSAAPRADNPTFYKDVQTILQNRCVECHRPGEVAPMVFTSYKETRPWAKAIREAVRSQKMPPWFADAAHGKFRNDRRLSSDEIDTLTRWADSGAAEGDPKHAPAPAQFAEGWSIGKPDVVIEMPTAFPVPASGTVDYVWFAVPTGFTEDRWIEKIEVRPGNSSVVHHVVLFARAPGSKQLKDVQPGAVPFFEPKDGPRKKVEDKGEGFLFGIGGDEVEMVSVYVPGGVAYQTQPGQARFIKAGSDLLFQMHYTANGKAATDRSRVGIVFAKEPPTERVVNTFIMNPNFRIPPMEANHPVYARVTLHEDVKLMSLFPHMHVRGKAFEYRATYPTGESEVLLRVPKYDFNWQLSYLLEKPILLPKGTKLEATAWYDNSPNNPSNPDPKSEVFWGEQTWEEMLAGFIDLAIPVGMKPSQIARPAKKQVQAKAETPAQ